MRTKNKWFDFSIYKNKEEQKFIVHWWWNVPKIPFESIEYSKTQRQHQLVFCGRDNLYWVFYKNEGKYKFFKRTINDHCSCG